MSSPDPASANSENFTDALFALALEADDAVSKTIIDNHLPGRIYEQPGHVIGRYTLVEALGEGGFGSVWRAEQSVPVARQVALKIIKLGMDTREVITRFEQERQALAIMDHPNIARVFDAGVTDAGRPYFVMELVKGESLTTYCDLNRLTIRQRLELFIQVCQAIQHAHQKGVIHRDLKPSNILVSEHDGAPVVRVIDFGVAKATERSLTAETLQTLAGQVIGTPGYMSPEQADPLHQDIDTRSDVYSLGAVLYELLTGTLPLYDVEFAHAALEAILRRIREQDPPRPSNRITSLADDKQAAAAQRRGVEPTRLQHAVRGDLDWIVMKCLEKDRQRRYETVSGLAADVLRHLNDEPITARPPNMTYVVGRTIRRHKLAFGTAAIIILTLIAGIITSTAFYLRAETRNQEAQQARSEQEMLKAEATASAIKFQQTATTADYQLATRSLTAESDKATLNYLARALETDPANHSAAALGMQTIMSRPRMLVRRAAAPAAPLQESDFHMTETYQPWRPGDIFAREAARILNNPAWQAAGLAAHPRIRDLTIPADRLIERQDYPPEYSFHTYPMGRGWRGHIAQKTCVDDLELACALTPDRSRALAVNRRGGWAIYRWDKVPVLMASGQLQNWPAEEFKRIHPIVYVDEGCQWAAVCSYDIKTGANNPACGLWRLSSGEQVLDTSALPLRGILAAGFHPSGSHVLLGTFGRKLLGVDLSTFSLLPFQKTYNQINGNSWPSKDGLQISAGKEGGGWGGEIMSACPQHAVVTMRPQGSSNGQGFENGMTYHEPGSTKEAGGWLKAVPEIHCGGATPVVLSINAVPNAIQWSGDGNSVMWCEGGKAFRQIDLSTAADASACVTVHVAQSAPVRHFRTSENRQRLIYTTKEGICFATWRREVPSVQDEVMVPQADLGKIALNDVLGRGCVTQRSGNIDVMRVLDMEQRTLLRGHAAIWTDKLTASDSVIRDMEFSPDGARMALIGSNSPSYHLMSSAFLQMEPAVGFRLYTWEVAWGLGSAVAWDSLGRCVGRGTSGSGCQFHRLDDPPVPEAGLGRVLVSEGTVDMGVCHLMAFLPQSGRHVLSACNESKTVRLWDRQLREQIAEWPFEGNIEALEVSPAGDRFAVITGKRLEVYWMPPVDETAPAWFSRFLTFLADYDKSTAEELALLAEIEKQVAGAGDEKSSPRLVEAMRWALAAPGQRPVFPGIRMTLAAHTEDWIQGPDAALRRRILSAAILHKVRSPGVYREAAKNPPEGLSEESRRRWEDYYGALAKGFQQPAPPRTVAGPMLAGRILPHEIKAAAHPVDTASSRWDFEVAEAYHNLSQAARGTGDLAVALSAGQAALKITQRHAQAQPEDSAWQLALAMSHYRVGAALKFQKDGAGAEPHLAEYCEIMRRLVASNPTHVAWLKSLANSHVWHASNAMLRSDWTQAEKSLGEQVAAYERLVALDAQDYEARRMIADGLNEGALILGRQSRHAEAVVMLSRSLQILEELQAGGKLSGHSLQWPANVRGNLKKAREMSEHPPASKP